MFSGFQFQFGRLAKAAAYVAVRLSVLDTVSTLIIITFNFALSI